MIRLCFLVMFRSKLNATNATIAVIFDVITVVLAIFLSVWIRFESGFFKVFWSKPSNIYYPYIGVSLLAIVFLLFVGFWLNIYKRPQRGTFVGKIPRFLKLSLFVSLPFFVLNGVLHNFLKQEISAGVLLIFTLTFFFLLVVEKGILFAIEIKKARKSSFENTILIIGANETAAHLVKCFVSDPRLRIKRCGVISLPGNYDIHPNIRPEYLLGTINDFFRLLDEFTNITQVVIADSSIDRNFLRSVIYECEKRFIRFNIVPDTYFMLSSAVEIETVDDIPLLGLRHNPLESILNRFIKRIEDIVCALIGLVVAGPIILFFAILVRCSSPGPIFFKQIRCGYGGKKFTIYKLRTMIQDAEATTGPIFADENDNRRTKIGAWMRSHNIDELPQLWNVLKGDMSMVGPRPERPVFVKQFALEINHYMRRHHCKPCITGWAQVHGLRGNTSIEERLKYDLWYQGNWSIVLDFKIMLRTLFALRNAY